MSQPSSLSLADADAALKQFSCLIPQAAEAAERPLLRQALLVVAQHSDYQMLGICADSLAEAQQALASYSAALGYSPELAFEPLDGPVYVKFNPKAALCYASAYEGEHRGVLVACQSAYEAGVNEMYGHLPLDLFAVTKSKSTSEAASE